MGANHSPEKGRVQLNVWLDSDERERLHREAAKRDQKAAQVIRGLIREWLDEVEVAA